MLPTAVLFGLLRRPSNDVAGAAGVVGGGRDGGGGNSGALRGRALYFSRSRIPAVDVPEDVAEVERRLAELGRC